jgi:hypothetical protein
VFLAIFQQGKFYPVLLFSELALFLFIFGS